MNTYRDLRDGGLLVLGADDHVAVVTPEHGWQDVPQPLAALIRRMTEVEEREGVRHG